MLARKLKLLGDFSLTIDEESLAVPGKKKKSPTCYGRAFAGL